MSAQTREDMPKKMTELPVFHALQILPHEETYSQLLVLKDLMSKSSLIYNAYEPNPEGELSFRDIYTYCNATAPVKRLWLHSLDKESLKSCYESAKPQENYDKLWKQIKYKR